MKIQIDTESKTISLEKDQNLKELIDVLEKLLPNRQWEEFTIKAEKFRYWFDPIIINPIHPDDSGKPYWENPLITCESKQNNILNLIIE